MTFIDHLKELRLRILVLVCTWIVFSGVCFYFFNDLVQFLSRPFSLVEALKLTDTLVIHSLLEGFTTKLRFSVLFGGVLSLPVGVYQTLRFVLPGLKRSEKGIVFLAIFFSTLLALFSFYMTYFTILPLSVTFLTSSQFIPSGVGLMLRYQENLFYVFHVLVYSILVFQFPIVLELLLYLGVVTRKRLLLLGRYVVVMIFVMSAIITPPDVVTQIGLALPLIVLYYLTILIAKVCKFGESHV